MINIPHVIKYMGSKRSILNFVTDTILELKRPDQRLYDLFGGSAVVGGSLRSELDVTCNDIQSYTGVIAQLYLQNYHWINENSDVLDKIVSRAEKKVTAALKKMNTSGLLYEGVYSFEDMKAIENKSQQLINTEFKIKDHLFVKNYSGTYWSFEQCLWIDSISSVAREETYRNSFLYPVIMSSLMFAMSYCSQSTGHYAQHRPLTELNYNDVLIYRNKSIQKLFVQKFDSLREFYNDSKNTSFNHETTTEDYINALEKSESNSIVYADPPYQFVHYSRFYHALETLVKYDYPIVEHKGRYRQDRHQSPFCIATKVKIAFSDMFSIIAKKQSTCILSYSHSGMISLEEILLIAKSTFSDNYTIEVKELNYKHSTMGRSGDKNRDVKEILLIAKPTNLKHHKEHS